MTAQKIHPCLWFDKNAEEAVNLYLSVFKDGGILRTTRYVEVPPSERPDSWPEPGSILTIEFELFGQTYMALNGGPVFQFNEAISLVVNCETQDEVDRYWNALIADGGAPVQCGWLKDKFGVSWQIVPRMLTELMASDDQELVTRVTRAMLNMVKLDIASLRKAAEAG